MLDLTRSRDKVVDAALRLAAEHGWSGLSLDKIAHEAGIGLDAFRREFTSKADILAAYTRAVDDAVLAKADPADASLAARDRLFDVLMTRFELMTPYKTGLKRIRADLRRRPGEGLAQMGVAARSLYWMLAAAGVDAEGSRGVLRVPGLLALYASVFDIWLEDDDAGLSRTMAALDSRLRKGERSMQRIDNFCEAAVRFCSSMVPGRAHGPQNASSPTEPASSPPNPAQANGSATPGAAPAT